jgi:hypothetical protein
MTLHYALANVLHYSSDSIASFEKKTWRQTFFSKIIELLKTCL